MCAGRQVKGRLVFFTALRSRRGGTSGGMCPVVYATQEQCAHGVQPHLFFGARGARGASDAHRRTEPRTRDMARGAGVRGGGLPPEPLYAIDAPGVLL